MKITEENIDEIQRELCEAVNARQFEREQLERGHGQVWDTEELVRDYHVVSFCAPFVLVRRKSDNQRGAFVFQHAPRYYWGFEPLDGDE